MIVLNQKRTGPIFVIYLKNVPPIKLNLCKIGSQNNHVPPSLRYLFSLSGGFSLSSFLPWFASSFLRPSTGAWRRRDEWNVGKTERKVERGKDGKKGASEIKICQSDITVGLSSFFIFSVPSILPLFVCIFLSFFSAILVSYQLGDSA